MTQGCLEGLEPTALSLHQERVLRPSRYLTMKTWTGRFSCSPVGSCRNPAAEVLQSFTSTLPLTQWLQRAEIPECPSRGTFRRRSRPEQRSSNRSARLQTTSAVSQPVWVVNGETVASRLYDPQYIIKCLHAERADLRQPPTRFCDLIRRQI